MQFGENSPKLANRYEFRSLVGHGGAGEVYAAWDDHLKRTVAIKRMKTTGIDDSVLANPWKEAIRLAAIHHSNIVTVFDMGQDEGVPYIVMEFVQGETLEERVTRSIFSLAEFGELARQSLDGLIAAHHAGLIHRDIKPSNIMLTTHPSGFFQVKILDFGTAKFLEAPSAQTMNLDGTIMGSVCWISPEQVNREPVDGRSDVYSLGCVYYYALTGLRPFDGVNALEILTAHLAHTLVSIETLRPDLPPLLCQWVMAMLNLRPEHRYQTAMQALASLHEILGYTPPFSTPAESVPTHPHVVPKTAPPPGSVLANPAERSKPVPLPDTHSTSVPVRAAVSARRAKRFFSLPSPSSFDFERMRWALLPLLTIAVGVLAIMVTWLFIDREKSMSPAERYRISNRNKHNSALQADTEQPTEAPATTKVTNTPSTVGTGGMPGSQAPSEEAAPPFTPPTSPPPIASVADSQPGSSANPAQPPAASQPAPIPIQALPTPTPAVPAQVVFRVHGSNAMGVSLLPALMEEFLKNEGGSRIVRKPGETTANLTIETALPGQPGSSAVEIASHGSKTAFEDLLAGRCDLGMSARPVKDEEAVAIAIAGLGDLHRPACEHVLALDGIAVVVHKDNPISNLTREQLAKIFSGEIADWSQAGGRAGPIRIYSGGNRSGTFDVFKTLVLERARLSPTAKLFEGSAELSDAVAADSSGIGYVSVPFVRNTKPVAVADDGMTPLIATPQTIATEDYILARRLFLYSVARPKNPWVRKFVDFALSDAGQKIVQKQGFVRQSPEEQSVPIAHNAPREFVELVKDAKRLSLNFRFKPGSIQLDNKAVKDLDRIGAMLALPQYQGRKLLLLGFSDNAGNPRANQRLSLERAQVVARELISRGIQPASVTGFGAIMPLTANDTMDGRDRNRRVEVWIK